MCARFPISQNLHFPFQPKGTSFPLPSLPSVLPDSLSLSLFFPLPCSSSVIRDAYARCPQREKLVLMTEPRDFQRRASPLYRRRRQRSRYTEEIPSALRRIVLRNRVRRNHQPWLRSKEIASWCNFNSSIIPHCPVRRYYLCSDARRCPLYAIHRFLVSAIRVRRFRFPQEAPTNGRTRAFVSS